jgi:hypothetical protein
LYDFKVKYNGKYSESNFKKHDKFTKSDIAGKPPKVSTQGKLVAMGTAECKELIDKIKSSSPDKDLEKKSSTSFEEMSDGLSAEDDSNRHLKHR